MGIFTESSGLHAIYDVELQTKHLLMGGIPADPRIIEAWIRTKTGGIIDRDEEVRLMMIRNLQEQGVEGIGPEDDFQKILDASAKIAAQKSTVGFKRNQRTGQLVIESRQIQAMLKENCNILYSDQRWGATSKSPKGMLAENVSFGSEYAPIWHVEDYENYERDELWKLDDPELVPVMEQDGIQLMIGHVDGASGKRSTLTYHQYVASARLRFRMMVIRDRFDETTWQEIWTACEGNGLGAVRSQLFGTFDLVRFDLVKPAKPQTRSAMQYITKTEQAKRDKEAAEKAAAVATAEEITTTGGSNGHGEPDEVETTSTIAVG